MLRWAGRLMVLVLLVAIIVDPVWAGFKPHKAINASQRLKELRIVRGRPRQGMALNEYLTRAEMVTVLVRALGREEEATGIRAAAYPDTAGHWANGYVAVARSVLAGMGEPLGYDDGTFRPDQQVTAAEMIAFLMKFLGVRPTSTGWPDNYIQAALRVGVIERDDVDDEDALWVTNARREAITRALLFYHADRAFSLLPIDDNGHSIYELYHGRRVEFFTVDWVADAATRSGNRFLVTKRDTTIGGKADPASKVTAYSGDRRSVEVAVTAEGGWVLPLWDLPNGLTTITFWSELPSGRMESTTIEIEYNK